MCDYSMQDTRELPKAAVSSPGGLEHRAEDAESEDMMEGNGSLSLRSICWGDMSWGASNYNRNLEFRTLFPSAPPTELLISDYSCAWAKDILIQGRMYITEGAVYFYATIFAWTYSLCIPFRDITIIEKRYFANLIPNSIEISTRENKYYFCTFMQRNSAYSLLHKLWLISGRRADSDVAKFSRSFPGDGPVADTCGLDGGGIPAEPCGERSEPPEADLEMAALGDAIPSIVEDVTSYANKRYASTCNGSSSLHPDGSARSHMGEFSSGHRISASPSEEQKVFDKPEGRSDVALKGIIKKICEKLSTQAYMSTQAPGNRLDIDKVISCITGSVDPCSAQESSDHPNLRASAPRECVRKRNSLSSTDVPESDATVSISDCRDREASPCNGMQHTQSMPLIQCHSRKSRSKDASLTAKKMDFPLKNIIHRMSARTKQQSLPPSRSSRYNFAEDESSAISDCSSSSGSTPGVRTANTVPCALDELNTHHWPIGQSASPPSLTSGVYPPAYTPPASPCTHKSHPTKIVERSLPLTPENIWRLWHSTESMLEGGLFRDVLKTSRRAHDVSLSEWTPPDAKGLEMLQEPAQETANPQTRLADIGLNYSRSLSYKLPVSGLRSNTTAVCYVTSQIIGVEGTSKFCIKEKCSIPKAPYGSIFSLDVIICVLSNGGGSSLVNIGLMINWTGYSLAKAIVNASISSELKTYYGRLLDKLSEKAPCLEKYPATSHQSVVTNLHFHVLDAPSRESAAGIPTEITHTALQNIPPKPSLKKSTSLHLDTTVPSASVRRAPPSALITGIFAKIFSFSALVFNKISGPIYAFLPVVRLVFFSSDSPCEPPKCVENTRISRLLGTSRLFINRLNGLAIDIHITFTAKSVIFTIIMLLYLFFG